MSGFEVAGVVLGAFPLLLSALEGYKNAATKARLWLNIRGEYEKCRHEVKAQEVALKSNLRILLLPLDIDNTKISRLLGAPGGDEWNDADITSQLKDRLHDSYEVFMETVRSIGDAAERLREELVVDDNRLQERIRQARVSFIFRFGYLPTYLFPSDTPILIKEAVSVNQPVCSPGGSAQQRRRH
jgi:hypothetical protein